MRSQPCSCFFARLHVGFDMVGVTDARSKMGDQKVTSLVAVFADF
jgi:hypothetical protein